MKQARENQHNLHTAYIDYKQAFSSIPHNYSLEILQTMTKDGSYKYLGILQSM